MSDVMTTNVAYHFNPLFCDRYYLPPASSVLERHEFKPGSDRQKLESLDSLASGYIFAADSIWVFQFIFKPQGRPIHEQDIPARKQNLTQNGH